MYAHVLGRRILCISEPGTTVEGAEKIIHVPSDLIRELGLNGIIQSCIALGDQIVKKSAPKDLSKLKLAFVGVWGIPCGIFTYSEALYPHFKNHFKDVKWFCESFDGPMPGDDWLVPCFKRGESMQGLVKALDAYKPDIVFIQHEYGIFPDAANWLSLISEISWKYEVFVQLHSVYKHRDKTICEAAIPNIFVHSELAKTVLEEKGVRANIKSIPHFCPPLGDQSRLWNLYKRDFTLVQFGFGFDYKGWDHAIDIVYKLKPNFPEIFYTAVISVAAHASHTHDGLISRLHQKISQLGLQDNVAIVKGFQTDEVIESYLRTNMVAIFPYVSHKDHEVFGASGASRHGIRFGTPTVVSGVPHFYDLRGVCAYGDTVEAMADEISRLFLSSQYREEVVKRQNAFALEHSPEKTVERICSLMSNPLAE